MRVGGSALTGARMRTIFGAVSAEDYVRFMATHDITR